MWDIKFLQLDQFDLHPIMFCTFEPRSRVYTSRVVRRIFKWAERQEMLVSTSALDQLMLDTRGPSLLGPTLHVVERLDDRFDDQLVQSISSIDGSEHRLLIITPRDVPLMESLQAVSFSWIEEPVVTPSNYRDIVGALIDMSRWCKFGGTKDRRLFIDSFRQDVANGIELAKLVEILEQRMLLDADAETGRFENKAVLAESKRQRAFGRLLDDVILQRSVGAAVSLTMHVDQTLFIRGQSLQACQSQVRRSSALALRRLVKRRPQDRRPLIWALLMLCSLELVQGDQAIFAFYKVCCEYEGLRDHPLKIVERHGDNLVAAASDIGLDTGTLVLRNEVRQHLARMMEDSSSPQWIREAAHLLADGAATNGSDDG